MALSSQYIAATDLSDYFVDKDTGLPLAGGQIQFWVDGARTTPKLVYQLTGDPTNSQGGGYSYDPLPNPVTLSNTGTIQDNNDNNVPIYYYPYDSQGQLELYYIVVLNANGVVQFTREGWPNAAITGGDTIEGVSISGNQVSNPQFSTVDFDGSSGLVISTSGAGTSTYTIAPDWDLEVTYNGTGSVTLNQVAIDGDENYPTNPPYWLSVSSTAAVTSLILKQRFERAPGLWSQTVGGVGGWLSGTILLGANSFATMSYVPSVGPSTLILDAVNATIVPEVFSASVQLPLSTNTDDGNDGYVELQISLTVNRTNLISSVQLVSALENPGAVAYVQESYERQQAQLFAYYQNGLINKPTKSFLVGWDFALNPAQINGDSATIGGGVDRSVYGWDQTIIYRATGPLGYSRAASGALRLTATVDTAVAIIQYLPQSDARQILNQEVSVMVSAVTSNAIALPSTVTLWYTTSAGNLPDASSGPAQSIVATLDENGRPLTIYEPSSGVWVELPRKQGFDATFNIASSPTTNFNNYAFNGWDLEGGADADTATFFAIVVGIGSLPAGETVDFNFVSLVPGSIPTPPAYQTANEVLLDCQRYFWKSYPANVSSPTGATPGMKLYPANYVYTGGATNYFPASFEITYPTTMRTTPDILLSSPGGGGNEIQVELTYNGGQATTLYSTTVAPVWTFTSSNIDYRGILSTIAGTPPSVAGAYNVDVTMRFFVRADARLGIIN